MPISCVYCGATHDRPDEVRGCWVRSQGAPQPTLLDALAPNDIGPERSEPGPPRASAPRSIQRSSELVAGPDELGRNLVIAPGDPVPEPWTHCARVVVDAAVLADPLPTVTRLRVAAHARERVVVELSVLLEYGQVDSRPLHQVGPLGELLLDELHHLVWSNSASAPVADDEAAWVDGGPLSFFDTLDGRPVVHRGALEHGSTQPFGTNASTADLAPDQLAAVTARSGVARIIAPAGSGKTRVLTERARHLVREWRLPPGAITMVAFNRRAQVEMETRLADVPGVQVRTLNSIALAIVNGVRPFASQPQRWQTLTEPDVRRILGEMVQSPRRRNVDPLAPWIEALSAVRLGLRRATDVEDLFDGDVAGLSQVLPLYEAELDRRGAVDFDGQVTRAISMLLTDPRTRAAAQRACRVLLVDEFQDLTPAHVLLVRLLGAPGGAVFGVGDDDQTIYGYNGADPRWLIEYAALFPAAEDHPLEVNYRCPADVVDGVARMLRRNTRRVPKTIRAAKSGTTGLHVEATDDPVGTTLVAVSDALAAGRAPADVAVLARVNATLVPVQVALGIAGIPSSTVVGTDWLNRTPVRAALAWLRLAVAPEGTLDPTDLAEAIRRPSRSLSPRVASWVAEQRSMSALHRLVNRIDGKDAPAVEDFVTELALARTTAATGTTDALLSAIFDEFGLAGTLASFDLNRRGTNTSAQGDDLLALRHLARLQPDPAAFPGWLRAQLERRGDAGGVTLATVHRVKGQEWPLVVVHLADTDQFPHRLAEDLEEERRLFHVALTRTSERVIVVTSARPSPFIRELTEEPSTADVATRAAAFVATRPGTASKPSSPGRDVFVSGRVVAGPGLVLVDQGSEWVIESVDGDGATAVTSGGARRLFRFGRKAATAGKQRGELAPPPPAVAPAAPATFDELRALRDQVRRGKPAYTVFADATLEAIALALPTTLADLARVKGVGPAKLEQYGDAVLDVVNTVLAAASPP